MPIEVGYLKSATTPCAHSRFEDSTDVAPEGASYAEIRLANSDERVQAPAANRQRMTRPVTHTP